MLRKTNYSILIVDHCEERANDIQSTLINSYENLGYRPIIYRCYTDALCHHNRLVKEHCRPSLIIVNLNNNYVNNYNVAKVYGGSSDITVDLYSYLNYIKYSYPDVVIIGYSNSNINMFNSKLIEPVDSFINEYCKSNVLNIVDKYIKLHQSELKCESLKGDNALITGPTGHVGTRLVQSIINHVPGRIFLVGRSENGKSLRQRLTYIPDKYFSDRKVIPIEFSLDQSIDHLLKSPQINELLNASQLELWLNAAYLSFNNKDKPQLQKTNVDGNRTLLKIAGMFNSIASINYIGTAFDSGITYAKDIYENHHSNYKPLNEYERSKGQAWNLIKKSQYKSRQFKLSTTMDSLNDNSTTSRYTFYGFLDGLITGMKMHKRKCNNTPNIRFLGNPENTINYIPVDIAVNWMMDIRNADVPLNGETYHIVGRNNIRTHKVFEVLGDLLDFSFEFVPYIPKKTLNSLERIYYRSVHDLYYCYITKETPNLRTDNTLRDLGFDYIQKHIPIIDKKHFFKWAKKYIENNYKLDIINGRVQY